MVDIKDKKKCCGCTACFNACPVNAIMMVKDDEGFYYPKIDYNKCIKCDLCSKVCPFINLKDKENFAKKIYNIHAKDEEILLKSSSGGVFPVLAKKIVELKGNVIAVNNKFNYVIIKDVKELSSLYGSKYVQVFNKDIFKKTKDLLINNEIVLFVGTPCTVNGLKNYLGKNYENLYTCDLICHGVPSELWLERYKKSFSKKVNNINFREKSHGWQDFCVKIDLDKKSYTSLAIDNEYMRAFLDNLCLRHACYDCKAKGNNRLSDITLGDYWGIDKAKDVYNYFGNSIIVINTSKGEEILNSVIDKFNFEELNEQELCKNSAYNHSVERPKGRDSFYIDLAKMPYNKFIRKYSLSPELKRKIRIKIKNLLGVK